MLVEVPGPWWVIDVEMLRRLVLFNNGEASAAVHDDAGGVVPSAAATNAIGVKDALVFAGFDQAVSCFIPLTGGSFGEG